MPRGYAVNRTDRVTQGRQPCRSAPTKDHHLSDINDLPDFDEAAARVEIEDYDPTRAMGTAATPRAAVSNDNRAAALFQHAVATSTHLAADGPTVRVGDPDGPKFEMLRRNVYLCKDRPRRMGHDDISVCCCRRAGPRRPQASRHGLRGPRIDAALALGGRAAGPCCAPCRGCTGPAS